MEKQDALYMSRRYEGIATTSIKPLHQRFIESDFNIGHHNAVQRKDNAIIRRGANPQS